MVGSNEVRKPPPLSSSSPSDSKWALRLLVKKYIKLLTTVVTRELVASTCFDSLTNQGVLWTLDSNNSCETWTSVHSNSYLDTLSIRCRHHLRRLEHILFSRTTLCSTSFNCQAEDTIRLRAKPLRKIIKL